jgi:hypothetical protein
LHWLTPRREPHIGTEYAVFGDRLKIADLEGLGRDGEFVGFR